VRGSKQHREICWQRPAHIWLTTYDTLRNDIETVLRSRQDGFGLVVADEAQKIKSPSIGISRALREISAEFKWGLTGTPLENSLDDVFSIFAFLKPGLFKVMWYRADEVKTIMQPYFLRRRKQDVLTDLPAIREDEVWLQLENEQRASYDRLEREGVLDLHQRGRDAITTTSILSLLTKLKQVCNRCPASDESSKLTWLRDSLESITAEGDKALIFTQYKLEDKSGADWLEKELLEYGVLNYGQATSDSKRAGLLKRFQNDPSQKVFIGHPKTAGLGLNELVAANYVIHFDHWWNPATTNQATARAHRPGQKKSVLVYHLWVQDTVEEMILSKVKQKLQLYNEVIDSLSAEISASDLSKVYWDVWNDLEKKYGLKITSKPSPQENVPIPPSRRTNL
jgi:SNF2 family DNA or RNA helicase